MPVLPDLVERALFRLGLAPRPLVDIAAAASFRVLRAALRSDLFERLARSPMTLEELASVIGAQPEVLADLLGLLEAAGHVRRRGDVYSNSPATARWLVRGANGSIAHFVDIWGDVVFDEWDPLERSLRTTRPVVHMHDWLTERRLWPKFNAAMAEFARGAADPVARAVRLRDDARSLIDLGGSHGLYAIAFCRRHPALRATVFDLPTALDMAVENAFAAGLGGRVTVRRGDMMVDDLGADHDVALLFQLIHYFDDAALIALLRRVRGALRPGGEVVILDQFTLSPPTPAARAFLRTLALQYRVSLGGRLRGFGEVRHLLDATGFASVRRKRLIEVPGNELVIARAG